MPQNCWNLFHLWNFQEYRLHLKTKIPVDWKIQSWSFGCNVEVITAKDSPQKRNFANGKKSFGFMVWKQWLSWPCSSWGLFSFGVMDCMEAGISHLIQHLSVSRLSILWTDLCLLGTCGKVFSIHSLRKHSLYTLNTAVSRQIFLLALVNTKIEAPWYLDTSFSRIEDWGLRIIESSQYSKLQKALLLNECLSNVETV